MRLYVMRHGIAEEAPANGGGADAERALTAHGKARVRAVARGLQALAVRPDQVWSSPLVRAVQTARIMARTLGGPSLAVRETETLAPGTPPGRLLEELARTPAAQVLCCGHAPGMDLLLAHCLAGHGNSFTALKKGGVACLELQPGDSPQAQLLWLLPPAIARRLG